MAASIRDALVRQLDDELGRTRRSLERVPQGLWAWRPHEKSTTMGALATHVATLAAIVPPLMTTESLDIARTGASRPQVQEASDLVPTCERLYAEARVALVAADDDDLSVVWALLANGRPVAPPEPRHVALTTHFFSHLVHHRAQLGVYLRLCDVAVPALYGPSADEPMG